MDMFDHLVTENNLWPEFEDYGLDKRDIDFIKVEDSIDNY